MGAKFRWGSGRTAFVRWAMGACAIATFASDAWAGPAAACDRDCLARIAGDYQAALIAHRPAALPLTPDVRFTENGVALAPGDALWATASGIAHAGPIVIDSESHSVALLATVSEGSRSALLAARITMRGRRIAAIETIVARPESATFLRPDGFGQPGADGSAGTRAALRAAAQKYFDGLVRPGMLVPPFSEDCQRVENGARTTNNSDPLPGVTPLPLNPAMTALSCDEQFRRGLLRFVSKVRELRYPVIDVRQGLVLAIGVFDHDGVGRAAAPGQAVSKTLQSPFSFAVAELFTIRDGRIAHIEALLTDLPYGMSMPWPK